MGKRGKRSDKHKKNNSTPMGQNGTKKVKGEWKCNAIPNEHPFFKEYYQKQLQLSEQDFNQFWAAMKEKLPVVFRVNPNCANHEAFCKKLQDQNFIKSIIPTESIQTSPVKQDTNKPTNQFQPKQMPKLDLIKWYPGNIVYTMNTTKQTFKKSKIFAQFHKYLQKSFDSGLISRQQLVSMLPPLYLNIQPTDMVLDLCAAPGSKTSQILQMIYGDRRWLAKGGVIANDADYSRAQMLIHQLHRSGTTGMAVINHPGQFMPELLTEKVGQVKNKFQFDKILCDVPCSGDGATRKLPIKWLNWHTSDGMVLHPLQLSILMKAINLLKKDGYLVYSTCSLNPIQNEAVVNSLFDKVGKGLELVDIHPMFGVKGRKGMLNWKVLAIADRYHDKNEKQEKEQQEIGKKYLKEYHNIQQASKLNKIKQTMFPPTLQVAKQRNLNYTMRVLPHDQNSGGFYVALFKKRQDFQWNYSLTQKKKMEQKGLEAVEQEFLEQNLPQLDEPVAKEQGEPEDNQKKANESGNDLENNQQIEVNEEQIVQKEKKGQKSGEKKLSKKQKKLKSSKYENYINIEDKEFQSIQKFYGISDEFKKLLYTRPNETETSISAGRKVLLISEGVHNYLEADLNKKIKLVNMGCQAFEKGKQSFSGSQCLYRLCQDGIHFLLEHIQQRKIKVSLEFFKSVISIKTLNHQQIKDKEIKQSIQKMSQGAFCIYIDENINGIHVVDALVGQNFKTLFHLMVSREDQASLAIRYL